MVMAPQANDRYKTLLAALKIIDPEGAFAPGTIEHNWAKEKILSWMDEMEPDEVLKRSESIQKVLRNKRPSWY